MVATSSAWHVENKSIQKTRSVTHCLSFCVAMCDWVCMEQGVEWLDTAMPEEAITKLRQRAVRVQDMQDVLKASSGLPHSGTKPELVQRLIENWHNVDQATFASVIDDRVGSQVPTSTSPKRKFKDLSKHTE